jgi:hypothetical protein
MKKFEEVLIEVCAWIGAIALIFFVFIILNK